ncbi:unnamed protein product [Rotaria socialis]|nr:unnamed protein product [Rotaria socialis]
MVSCTNALFCGDKVNAQFETKYDNNHNELQQVLAEHKTFTSSSWTHYVLPIQIIITCRGKLLKNRINGLTSITTSYYQPPYAHTPNSVINQPLHSPLNQIVS